MTILPWVESLKKLIGSDRVILDNDVLDRHSYDRWPVAAKWHQQGKRMHCPDVVVFPHNTQEISRLVMWANEWRIPITPWGAGSSVTGSPLPLKGGITLDMKLMSRILSLDETNLLVRVEAGTMGQQLESMLNSRGYTLHHSPQSLGISTVGGWVATHATGQFSSRWGGIEDLTAALQVVLPQGEIVETKLAPRAAIGPSLKHIFIGSEGTLGVVTEVTLKIFPIPEHQILEAIHFDSIEAGISAMQKIMRLGLQPFLVRFYDEDEARHVLGSAHSSGCVMFLGHEGIKTVAEAEHAASREICLSKGGFSLGAAPVLSWMSNRFDFSTVEKILEQPGGFAETIEVADFWGNILQTYQSLKDALRPQVSDVFAHFSHVYPQGTSLYMILLGQARSPAEAEERLMEIWDVTMKLCLERGAVTSHHHGVGLARLPYIQQELATGMTILQRLKGAIDPAQIMNPGKLGLNSSP